MRIVDGTFGLEIMKRTVSNLGSIFSALIKCVHVFLIELSSALRSHFFIAHFYYL